MKRYSLYIIVFAIFVVMTIVNLVMVYFFTSQHKKDLLDTAIEEKARLAETVNDVFFSPQFNYEISKTPALEKFLIVDMAKFKDVKYIRIVEDDGMVYRSSLDDDWDKTINDPDRQTVVRTKKYLVKDEIFNGENIKTIIYPSQSDRTIWIGFSLDSVKTITGVIFTRDISTIFGGLILAILMVFVLLRWGIIVPLKQLNSACQNVKNGNFDSRIDIKSKTEIGQLAESFNEMVDFVKQSNYDMQKVKSELEAKVSERTKKLRQLAKGLDEQVKNKTQELYEKMAELEKFNKLAVGREEKMILLKEEIDKLNEELACFKDKKRRSAKPAA